MTASAAGPSRSEAPDPTPGALSRLILEANAVDSYQRIAARAVDPLTGETLSKPYLHKIATGQVKSAPSAAALRAIAAGIRKPEIVIQRAAAEQWLGYHATELAGYDDDVRIIVGHLAGKSKSEVRRWRAMIEADEQAAREE